MSVSLYGNGQTVIQVVQGTLSTVSGTSTTSTSFVTTGLSVTITPQSTTSKILIFADGQVYNASLSNTFFTIYRGSSNLNTGASLASLCGTYSGSATVTPVNMIYLDSPSTTSATTYTVYFAVSGGTAQYPFNPGGGGNTIATITALEISGS